MASVQRREVAAAPGGAAPALLHRVAAAGDVAPKTRAVKPRLLAEARRGKDLRKSLQSRQQRVGRPSGSTASVEALPTASTMTGLETAQTGAEAVSLARSAGVKLRRAPTGGRPGAPSRVIDGIGMARVKAATARGDAASSDPTFLTPPPRARKDVADTETIRSAKKAEKASRKQKQKQKQRSTRDKKTTKPPVSSWSASGAADTSSEASAAPGKSMSVWRAPQARPARKSERKRAKPPPRTPARVRPQDLDESALEGLREEEVLVVLQALSTKSPEAQQMLDDVMRRLSELRLFDTFRQI